MAKITTFAAAIIIAAGSLAALAGPLAAKGGGGGGGHGGGGGGGGHGFGGGGGHGFGGGGGGHGFGGGHAFGGGRGFGGGHGGLHFGGGHGGGHFAGGHGAHLHFGGGHHGGGFHRVAGGGHAGFRHGVAAHGLGRHDREFAAHPAGFGHAGFGAANAPRGLRSTTGLAPPVPRGAAIGRTGAALGLFAHPAYRVAAWPGPVFWPYAVDDVFWPSAYDAVFWDYGPDDILAGTFWPETYRETYGPRLPQGLRHGRREPMGRAAEPPTTGQLCGEQPAELVDTAVIEQQVELRDDQRKPFDELKAAEAKAAEILKSACPRETAATPTDRLAAMKQWLGAMLDAVRTVKAPLGSFYDALDDEQRARLLAGAGDRRDWASRWLEKCRGMPATWGSLSMNQVARELRLDQTQLDALDDLSRASEQAAEAVRNSCPSEVPLAATTRLAAIETRLVALVRAVDTMRPALDRFYASLGDEQKVEFDRLGRSFEAGRLHKQRRRGHA